MRITILSIIDSESRVVQAESPIGLIEGVFDSSDDFSLQVGLECAVEFDIDIPLEWGNNMQSYDEIDSGFSTSTSKVTINGIIDVIDDEGRVAIRLASDCLINAETFSDQLKQGIRVQVIIASHDLILCPYDDGMSSD